ncbi:F0F1 ATP synthase subunit delta [soil metagenome]
MHVLPTGSALRARPGTDGVRRQVIQRAKGSAMTLRSSASRYARALFDVGRAEGLDLDRIGDELSGVAALVAGNEQLQRVLGNPAIPASRKRGVVEGLLALSPLSPVVSRLLLLLADRDRLVLLPGLADAYRTRLMDFHNVVRAEITTAVPIPPDRVAALQGGLARLTGKEVQLGVTVDPSLVGGAVARIGSTVYDGSVTTQLEKLRQQLVLAEV